MEFIKRQDGVGASLKGQCRLVRPYDRWRAPDVISDPEALESFPEYPASRPSHLEGGGDVEEAGWSRRVSKWSVRPYDSSREPYVISDPEALESFPGSPALCSSHLEGVGDVEEAGWSRRLFKGSVRP